MVVFSFSEAKAEMSLGAGIVYGTNINNIGIGVNGKYVINETWSAAPSFTYFLKKNMVNWSSLDLDANYNFTEIENLGKLYAIGGLNMTFFKIKYDMDLGGFGDFSDCFKMIFTLKDHTLCRQIFSEAISITLFLRIF